MEPQIEKVIEFLSDKKGEDIVALDVSSKVDYTDYLIICSATSTKHAQALADYLKDQLEKEGRKPLSVEGWEIGQWILLDYGSFVVHIFFKPIRDYYGLEELWSDFPPQRVVKRISS
ncbi:MAG: ribosome silencing factor [Thermodesulfobacteriaceae bacterium]|nr:ribosome silencing factor [Thermodesulfobacteriaceae bacterium]